MKAFNQKKGLEEFYKKFRKNIEKDLKKYEQSLKQK